MKDDKPQTAEKIRQSRLRNPLKTLEDAKKQFAEFDRAIKESRKKQTNER